MTGGLACTRHVAFTQRRGQKPSSLSREFSFYLLILSLLFSFSPRVAVRAAARFETREGPQAAFHSSAKYISRCEGRASTSLPHRKCPGVVAGCRPSERRLRPFLVPSSKLSSLRLSPPSIFFSLLFFLHQCMVRCSPPLRLVPFSSPIRRPLLGLVLQNLLFDPCPPLLCLLLPPFSFSYPSLRSFL